MLLYSFKRVLRGWRLFLALTLGILLAATFFTGINVGADAVARQSLEQTLQQLPVDAVASSHLDQSRSGLIDELRRLGE